MSAIPPRIGLEAPSFADEAHDPGWLRLRADGMPLVLFTTRRGGRSRPPFDSLNLGRSSGDDPELVLGNRARLVDALGIEPPATAHQVHGATLLSVTGGGPAGEGDVLATDDPETALAIATADCFGVVVWSEDRRALAVAHAGWRGVVAGAVDAACAWVAERAPGSPPLAALGPGIGPCCFEVGDDVAARFPAECVRMDTPRPHVNLPQIIRRQLSGHGIDAGRLYDLSLCTVCDRDRFFSHRRDRGRTGRMWTLARLRPGRVG